MREREVEKEKKHENLHLQWYKAQNVVSFFLYPLILEFPFFLIRITIALVKFKLIFFCTVNGAIRFISDISKWSNQQQQQKPREKKTTRIHSKWLCILFFAIFKYGKWKLNRKQNEEHITWKCYHQKHFLELFFFFFHSHHLIFRSFFGCLWTKLIFVWWC